MEEFAWINERNSAQDSECEDVINNNIRFLIEVVVAADVSNKPVFGIWGETEIESIIHIAHSISVSLPPPPPRLSLLGLAKAILK
jgi:hypothetical protein